MVYGLQRMMDLESFRFPAIDAGYNNALPSDSSDLDGDGNITEAIPYDALRRSRVIGPSGYRTL